MKVYLAGPQTDDWRAAFMAARPSVFFAPHSTEPDDDWAQTINESDMRAMHGADVVVAYCPRASWRLAMEIDCARRLSKQIIVVVPEDVALSLWLVERADEVVRELWAVML